MTRYTERLAPPWWWYPAGVLLAVGLGYEVGVNFFVVVSAVGALVLIAVATLILLGRRKVEVRDGELLAGRQRIGVDQLAAPVLLSGEALRRRLGPQADPAAHICVSWWIHTGLEFAVRDPANPTPYWVVSTRQPVALATAVETERSS